MLAPRQLGFGVKGGAEAAAHATRRFVDCMAETEVLVKLDFRNAFNTCRRDVFLERLAMHVPELLPYATLCYGTSSTLTFGEGTISSAEGIQQGDPMGPMLFCLSIHTLLLSLSSEVTIAYLDDVTLGEGGWRGTGRNFSYTEGGSKTRSDFESR